MVGGEDKFSKVRAAAWPVMRDLTATLIWPSELAVFRADEMLIIRSTHRLSSMSSDVSIGGQSRPLLFSSLGLAYLGNCDKNRRDVIAARLRAGGQKDASVAPEATDQVLEAARQDGFSICGDLEQQQLASLAVPLCIDGEPVASLSVVWQIADMTFDQARERLAAPLMAARSRVETQLQGPIEDIPARHTAAYTPLLFDENMYTRRTLPAVAGRAEPEALRVGAV